MGASIEQGSGAGARRKRTQADLNLVPYIDLLTCMVSFLLITAVWTQLARLPVTQTHGSPDGEARPPELKLAVLVTREGMSLRVNDDVTVIPKQGQAYDFARLRAELAKLKAAYPDKTDLSVIAEDSIAFETLAATMDGAIGARFPDVSLADAGGT